VVGQAQPRVDFVAVEAGRLHLEIVAQLPVVKGLLVPLVLQTLAFSNPKWVVWIRNAPPQGANPLAVEGHVLRGAGLLVVSGEGRRLDQRALKGLHSHGRPGLVLQISGQAEVAPNRTLGMFKRESSAVQFARRRWGLVCAESTLVLRQRLEYVQVLRLHINLLKAGFSESILGGAAGRRKCC